MKTILLAILSLSAFLLASCAPQQANYPPPSGYGQQQQQGYGQGGYGQGGYGQGGYGQGGYYPRGK